ncbi:GNAT family N-acetyltransferase [Pseudomonas sp.]|uniref:GNAT family N-acetyltransferase n=1 Tax=Pseudomonas sp. TaxID=306 RepID=UPI0031E3C696
MNAILQIPNPRFELMSERDIAFDCIASCLESVAAHYPGFKEWLYFTFRTGLIQGKRSVLLARSNNDVMGLSLLKHDGLEKKICTFFVLPEYRGIGVARELMNHSLSNLGEANIGITVSEERNDELYPLLASKGFTLHKAVAGYYRNSKIENFYSL